MAEGELTQDVPAAAGQAPVLSSTWKGAAEGREKGRFDGEWRWCWLFVHQRHGHRRMTVREGWERASCSPVVGDLGALGGYGEVLQRLKLDMTKSLDLWLFS